MPLKFAKELKLKQQQELEEKMLMMTQKKSQHKVLIYLIWMIHFIQIYVLCMIHQQAGMQLRMIEWQLIILMYLYVMKQLVANRKV